MKTIGTLFANIILIAIIFAIIIGICKLGHHYGLCNCGDYPEDSTNETYGVRSNFLPYMANPVHNWHPANINHVHHR